jgi:Fe2+ transport system protein B
MRELNRTFCNWRKPSYTILTAAFLRVVTFHVYIPYYFNDVWALMAGNQYVISYYHYGQEPSHFILQLPCPVLPPSLLG